MYRNLNGYDNGRNVNFEYTHKIQHIFPVVSLVDCAKIAICVTKTANKHKLKLNEK